MHWKLALTAPQKIDDGDKRCAGSRSKRNGGGKGGNVNRVMFGEGIDDRIDEGCAEGIDKQAGEVVSEVGGDGVEGVVGLPVDEAIRCFCAFRPERGEMVCCDVCECWSTLDAWV